MTGRMTGGTADMVPRADYEALLERLEDLEDRLAIQAAQGEERVPSEFVDRLIAGVHPMRLWREHRGKTLTEVSAAAGVPVGYLSEIETGGKPGSVKAFRAVARVLGVTVDDLLPIEPEPGETGH
jgi:hypothetical protein